MLKLNEGAATITELIMAQFELEEEEILLGSGTKFFEENGTIKCPGATPGEKGTVNDKIYEAVDRALLIQRRDEDADLTCVCTTLVTDMSSLYKDAHSFNQPIGKWNVSNVTNMFIMFSSATTFNQPIGEWDVGNVTDMSRMFEEANSFNQPIEAWDIKKVRNMSRMFRRATLFNQDLSGWCILNLPTEPANFSTESALLDAHKPVWGTCPE